MLKNNLIKNCFVFFLFMIFMSVTSAKSDVKTENIKIRITFSHILDDEYRSNNSSKNLNAELAYPISLKPLLPQKNYPKYIEIRRGSAYDHISRQYIATYSPLYNGHELTKRLNASSKIERAVYIIDIEGSLKLAASNIPNDPFYINTQLSNPKPAKDNQSWYFEILGLPKTWEYGTGYANIGILDSGFDIGHPDLQENWRPHWSYDFVDSDPIPNSFSFVNGSNTYKGHGTHVMGLIGADSNNKEGVSGVCQNCNLMVYKGLTINGTIQPSLIWAAENGAQIVNLSAGGDFTGSCNSQVKPIYVQDFCAAIEIFKENDTAFIAASGNDLKSQVWFPAKEDSTIAVGGIDEFREMWDERNYNGCPKTQNPNDLCGSNKGAKQDFVAPSRDILSTMDRGFDWLPPQYGLACGDSYSTKNNDGYGPCTGTSMATPLISGIFGLLRSLNPLLKVEEVKKALTDTASNKEVHDSIMGWGIPNTGYAAEKLLGVSNGTQLVNRLNPVFILYHGGVSPTPENPNSTTGYFFTPRPKKLMLQLSELCMKNRIALIPSHIHHHPQENLL